MEVKNNEIITFYAIEWNDGWEFGSPCIVLNPLVKYYYDGESIEDAIDDLCLDLSTDSVESEREDNEEWRGYNIPEFRKFVQNRINDVQIDNKEYEVPEYFRDYFEALKEDFEEDEEDEEDKFDDEDISAIINLTIGKIQVKFIYNEENDWYNYETVYKKIISIKING